MKVDEWMRTPVLKRVCFGHKRELDEPLLSRNANLRCFTPQQVRRLLTLTGLSRSLRRLFAKIRAKS